MKNPNRTGCRCNEGTIVDGALKYPNRTGFYVIETISQLKFPQIQGSLQLTRKKVLDQVAYLDPFCNNTSRSTQLS